MNMQVWNPFQEFENLLSRYNRGGGLPQQNSDLSFADWGMLMFYSSLMGNI